jgi:hypothetical protein
MGGGRFDSKAWSTYSASTSTKTAKEIFKSSKMDKLLDPKGITLRESRDSPDNPLSTPLAVAIDVTGSMGIIGEYLAKTGLGTLFTEVLERKPISDPHLCFMAVGDVTSDQAPLQVSQFEADNRIIEQLTKIFVEGNGGGNSWESYNLPWYFAARHTSIDSYENRAKRGYLFTVGDEGPPKDLTGDQLAKVFGDTVEGISNADLLEEVRRMYHVFHVVVAQGSHCQHHGADRVIDLWRPLMGQHVLRLDDYKKLSEVIVSTIQVIEGEEVDAVAASWSGSTAVTVRTAIKDLVTTTGSKKAVTRFT